MGADDKFLIAVLKRTVDQAKSWGLWAGGILEIIAIGGLLFLEGWSWEGLGRSAFIGLISILLLAIGTLVWNAASEPYRRIVTRLDTLEGRDIYENRATTSPSVDDRVASGTSALRELKVRVRQLIKTLRLLWPSLKSSGFSRISNRDSVDENTVKELDDDILFFIDEIKSSDPKLHKCLQYWYSEEDNRGMSVKYLLNDIHSLSWYGDRSLPSFDVAQRFLRQRLLVLQELSDVYISKSAVFQDMHEEIDKCRRGIDILRSDIRPDLPDEINVWAAYNELEAVLGSMGISFPVFSPQTDDAPADPQFNVILLHSIFLQRLAVFARLGDLEAARSYVESGEWKTTYDDYAYGPPVNGG